MAKEEILAMEAGAELDRLIAERVFQRVVKSWETFQGKPIYQMQVPSDYGEVYEHLFHYSTDISAAWQVVEEISQSLFSTRLRFLVYLQEQTRHEIAGTHELVTVAWPDVFWRITPETICKAALLAKLEAK